MTPDGLLPPVLPVVIYNGEPDWTAALEVSELIEPVPGGDVLQMNSDKRRLLFQFLPSQPKRVHAVIRQFGQEEHARDARQLGRRPGRKPSQFVQLDGRRQPQLLSQLLRSCLQRQQRRLGNREGDFAHGFCSLHFGLDN